MRRNLAILVLVFWCPAIDAADDGFKPLFDGNDLSGWRGLDGFWSVKDGAIVGQTTKDKPLDGNTFLIWQGGEVADFESLPPHGPPPSGFCFKLKLPASHRLRQLRPE